MTDAPGPTPDQPLDGRVAMISGGSRGMGLAMAGAFAAAGADLVIASRKLDACQVAADEIGAATGRVALYFATDASSFTTGAMLVVDGGTSLPE